jgi:hypothetical protein
MINQYASSLATLIQLYWLCNIYVVYEERMGGTVERTTGGVKKYTENLILQYSFVLY